MQTASVARGRIEFPEEGLHIQWCDDCGRIATEFIPGEHFGCFRVADLWLCDDCARAEIARRVKFPPRGVCEECRLPRTLHPLWTWYSSDYFAGAMPSRFICGDCKKKMALIRAKLQRIELEAEEGRFEEGEITREIARIFIEEDYS